MTDRTKSVPSGSVRRSRTSKSAAPSLSPRYDDRGKSQISSNQNKLLELMKTIESSSQRAWTLLSQNQYQENAVPGKDQSEMTMRLERELETLNMTLQIKDEEIRKLKAYKHSPNQDDKLKRYDEEIDELKYDLNTRKKDLAESNSRYKAAEEQKYAYENELHEIKKTLAEKDKTIEDLKKQIRIRANIVDDKQKRDEDVKRHRSELADVKKMLKEKETELEEKNTRLSRFMGNQLSNNNPNITDLSDKNRPTKLGERYQELYDNQWTDAFEQAEKYCGTEQETVGMLIKILKATKEFCEMEVNKQDELLKEAFLRNTKYKMIPDHILRQLKDCRKEMVSDNVTELHKNFLAKTEQISLRGQLTHHLKEYVNECIELCWLMSLQDPPVVFGPNVSYYSPLDSNVYRTYTRSGKYLEFVVWPPVYLHKDGPILAKGVAQGMVDSVSTSDRQTDKDNRRAKSFHGNKTALESDNTRSRCYTPETKIYENSFSEDRSSAVTNGRNYQQQTQPTSTRVPQYTYNVQPTDRDLEDFYWYLQHLGEAKARKIMGDRFDVCVQYIQQHGNYESSA